MSECNGLLAVLACLQQTSFHLPVSQLCMIQWVKAQPELDRDCKQHRR